MNSYYAIIEKKTNKMIFKTTNKKECENQVLKIVFDKCGSSPYLFYKNYSYRYVVA